MVTIFECFCRFLSLKIFYRPTKFFRSCRWVTWQNSRDKKWFLTFFSLRSWNFCKICTFQFFSVCFNYKQSWKTGSCRVKSLHGKYSWLSFSLSLCQLGFFPSLNRSLLSLSQSISLPLALSFSLSLTVFWCRTSAAVMWLCMLCCCYYSH